MKAVCLFSGGLDSQLAVRLIKEQGIIVTGLNFSSPFFGADSSTYLAAEKLEIELFTADTGKEYIDKVLRNPVYGYGKNLNPCIDCHAFMLKKAGEFMKTVDASFIITGEVVGQRPMSQNKSALNAVDKLSGYRGLIVRPLSAKLLPPSIPENENWIDRSQLLDISGRGRSRQIELAEKFAIYDYPNPAGGCLLTEANFSRRLKKLFALKDSLEIMDFSILKLGRHFFIGDNNLLVIGRKHTENEDIRKLAVPGDYLFKVSNRPGPLGLLRTFDSDKQVNLEYAASIVARYSDARNEKEAAVKVFDCDDRLIVLMDVNPMLPEDVPQPV